MQLATPDQAGARDSADVRSALLLALVFCASCRTPYPKYQGGDYEAPVRIPFIAPDFPFAQKSVTRRVEKTASGATLNEETVELIAHSSFAPMEGERGGLLFTQTIESLQSTPARPTDAALSRVLTATPLRIQLASDGSFIRLLNAEAFAEAYRSVLPPSVAATLTPTSVEEDARREWESRFAVWFGRNVTQGQRVYSLERLPLSGGGELHYLLERTVAGVIDTPKGRKLAIGLRCLSDPAEAPELEVQLERPLEPSVRCEGQEELQFEPLLPLRATLTLTATPQGRGELSFTKTSEVRDE